MTLDQITAESFLAHVGSDFLLTLGEGHPPVSLALKEVTLSPHGIEGARTPFSVIFEGPADPPLGQHTYAMSHQALGDLAIFIVPVAGDSQSRKYQAIFS